VLLGSPVVSFACGHMVDLGGSSSVAVYLFCFACPVALFFGLRCWLYWRLYFSSLAFSSSDVGFAFDFLSLVGTFGFLLASLVLVNFKESGCSFFVSFSYFYSLLQSSFFICPPVDQIFRNFFRLRPRLRVPSKTTSGFVLNSGTNCD